MKTSLSSNQSLNDKSARGYLYNDGANSSPQKTALSQAVNLGHIRPTGRRCLFVASLDVILTVKDKDPIWRLYLQPNNSYRV